jgi:hypothetical protein
MTAERETIFSRHHDIQDHKVDGAVLENFPGFSRASGRAQPKAFLREIGCQRIADIRLIINDEYMWLGIHVPPGAFLLHYGVGTEGVEKKIVSKFVRMEFWQVLLQKRGIWKNFRQIS